VKRKRSGNQDCQINAKCIAEGEAELEEYEGTGEFGLRT